MSRDIDRRSYRSILGCLQYPFHFYSQLFNGILADSPRYCNKAGVCATRAVWHEVNRCMPGVPGVMISRMREGRQGLPSRPWSTKGGRETGSTGNWYGAYTYLPTMHCSPMSSRCWVVSCCWSVGRTLPTAEFPTSKKKRKRVIGHFDKMR